MNCFECSNGGATREAVALCHHCSAGLCSAHVIVVDDPVKAVHAVVKTIVLPLHARLMLCHTCKAALEQMHQSASEPQSE